MVSHVFLSHNDFEHAGGLPAFSQAKTCYVQTEGWKLIRQPKRFRRTRINQLCKPLRDRETVDIGAIKVTALHTPGHTKGSTSYLVDGRYLFTGDTLTLKDGKACVNLLFSMNIKALRRSAKALSKLEGVQTLLTAHWGYASYTTAFSDWKPPEHQNQ